MVKKPTMLPNRCHPYLIKISPGIKVKQMVNYFNTIISVPDGEEQVEGLPYNPEAYRNLQKKAEIGLL